MKKLTALLIAALMLVCVLTGCADQPKNNEEQSKVQESENNTENTPETPSFGSSDKLYVHFIYSGEDPSELTIAVDQVTEETYLLYVADEPLKLYENVYEVTDSTITKYYKDALMDTFEQETELTQAKLQEEVEGVLSLLAIFSFNDSYLNNENIELSQSDESEYVTTGDAVVYDTFIDGEYAGRICVDEETDLIVKIKDAEGNLTYTVEELKTSDFEIPAYK